jgi:hypothetical protein
MEATSVFTAGVTPTVTYCSRDKQGLESRLRHAISVPGDMPLIVGPSKSGKTVLYETILRDAQYVVVDGGDASTEEEFFGNLRSKLGLPDEATRGKESGKRVVGSAESKLSIGLRALLGLDLAVGGSAEASTQTSTNSTFDGLSGVNLLVAKDWIVVVDDFHYIPREVQKQLMRRFKAAIQKHAKIVLVLTSGHEEDLFSDTPDLTGRIVPIEVPKWEWDELRVIPQTGFRAMRISPTDECVEFLLRESIYSPQIMQSLCLSTCLEKNLMRVHTSSVITLGVDTNEQKRILERVANRNSFRNEFNHMARAGIRTVSASTFKGKDGSLLTLNGWILKAIAEKAEAELMFNELVWKIGQLVDEQESKALPADSEIMQTIATMSEKAASASGQRVCMSWHGGSQRLVVESPHFVCYLRGSDCWADLSQ